MKKLRKITLNYESIGDLMTKYPKIPETDIIVFAGHFGSGKTENAINYSMWLQSQGEQVSLIDLDIINPYFRSREVQTVLEEQGINPIIPRKELQQADFPVITPQVRGALSQPEGKIIVDLGGDPDGSIPMGSFKNFISEENYEMWLVLNANRIQTSNYDKTIDLAKNIQKSSRLKITGIINNTHMKNDTTEEDIIKGYKFSQQVSQYFGVPLIYTTVPEQLITKFKEKNNEIENNQIENLMPIKNYLTTPWE
ncbi:hypothetical protein [Natranaerobius thermophilus]|uniref:CobQ/CobB/MinD/ParA nucleotide binding domain-containing protein n=1 Tax=Natranaerobius thermophilus (strain ATCC BAA-1301 / DSM 18059 / JW/NM-WN-LF) TaxID=457570 RepID=B2A511_NATTJ|nr:hypothetical protein [Natranaerobius thermophilus]ACB85253.1 conserved hypothetical protein [Natranaerobius thermophilus JW/NM-WN-LF]